jgi:hypothetical protein
MSDPSRDDELINRYLDNTASDEEVRELDERLAHSSEMSDKFARYSRLHEKLKSKGDNDAGRQRSVTLRFFEATITDGPSSAGNRRDAVPDLPAEPYTPPGRPPRNRWIVWMVLATILTAGIVIYFMVLNRGGAGHQSQPQPPSSHSALKHPVSEAEDSAARNLFFNASFETDLDEDEYPDQWDHQPGMRLDRSVARTGTNSLKVQGGKGPTLNYTNNLRVKLKTNTDYRFSVWAKNNGVAAGRGQQIRYAQILPHFRVVESKWFISEEWIQISIHFRTPSKLDDYRLDFVTELFSNNEVAWFDDAELIEVGSESPISKEN